MVSVVKMAVMGIGLTHYEIMCPPDLVEADNRLDSGVLADVEEDMENVAAGNRRPALVHCTERRAGRTEGTEAAAAAADMEGMGLEESHIGPLLAHSQCSSSQHRSAYQMERMKG